MKNVLVMDPLKLQSFCKNLNSLKTALTALETPLETKTPLENDRNPLWKPLKRIGILQNDRNPLTNALP